MPNERERYSSSSGNGPGNQYLSFLLLLAESPCSNQKDKSEAGGEDCEGGAIQKGPAQPSKGGVRQKRWEKKLRTLELFFTRKREASNPLVDT